jgi:hypothetical protein
MQVMLDTLTKLEEALACHKDNGQAVYLLRKAQAAIMRGQIQKMFPSRKKNPSVLTQEERDYLCNGLLIPAIKSYRERTGVGLTDGKNFMSHQAVKLGYAEYAYGYNADSPSPAIQWLPKPPKPLDTPFYDSQDR